jgi:hypothetical protein
VRLVSAPGVSRLMQVIRRPSGTGLGQFADVIVLLQSGQTGQFERRSGYGAAMSEILEVREVIALVRPMFRGMLHAHEFATLTLHVASVDDQFGTPLADDDLLEQSSAEVRWRP